MHFLMPKTFKCGSNIPWNELAEWHGEGGKCGQGLLHTVIGQVPVVKDGFVKAKIIVPEDNNREWPPYNGEVHTINNNKFEISFCITTRLATRPIWIQAYSKDGKKSGGRCTVTLVGVQLVHESGSFRTPSME